MDTEHFFPDYIFQGTYNNKFHKIFNNKNIMGKKKIFLLLQHDKVYVGVIMQMLEPSKQIWKFLTYSDFSSNKKKILTS